jgi:hypothetical protein
VVGDQAQQQDAQQATEVLMSRRRNVNVDTTGTEILAAVASIAVDPRCPECGGPAELGTDRRGRVTVAIDHLSTCEHAHDGQNRRPEPPSSKSDFLGTRSS